MRRLVDAELLLGSGRSGLPLVADRVKVAQAPPE
jgi:hypothetical protein